MNWLRHLDALSDLHSTGQTQICRPRQKLKLLCARLSRSGTRVLHDGHREKKVKFFFAAVIPFKLAAASFR